MDNSSNVAANVSMLVGWPVSHIRILLQCMRYDVLKMPIGILNEQVKKQDQRP